LAGGTFMNAWRTRTTKDLFDYMSSTMPPNQASLAPDQYAAIVSFILQANGAPAGTRVFTPATAVPIGTVATGTAPPQGRAGGPGAGGAAAAGGQGRANGPGGAVARGATTLNGPTGLVIAGTVKNYTPVTDEMLRNEDPGDWLMARRNYQ